MIAIPQTYPFPLELIIKGQAAVFSLFSGAESFPRVDSSVENVQTQDGTGSAAINITQSCSLVYL